MGGIGKTAVALTIAQAVRRGGARVFWVQASHPDSVMATLHQIAVHLGGPETLAREVAAGRLNAADMAWEALHSSSRPWLLVFDSADDPVEIERELGPGWLDASASGGVLVTTRHGSTDLWPAQARMVRLEPLDPHSGARMLLDLADRGEADSAEREAARALSERLGGIPLALRLAGCCVSQPLSSLPDFAAFRSALDRDFGNVVDHAASASLRPPTEDDARSLVMRTWEVSLDALEQQGIPHVRSIMRVLSCWAARPVPLALISPKVFSRTHGADDGPWDDLVVRRALRALSAVGLIDIVDENPVTNPLEGESFYQWASDDQTHKCIVVHPLVSEVNAVQLERSPDRTRSWEAAARCLGSLRGVWGTKATASYWQLALPHLMSMVDRLPVSCDGLFDTVVGTHTYLSRYLRMSGQYETAYRSAMSLRGRMDGFRPSDRIRFAVEYNCAEWSWHMSHLEEADALAAEACRLAEGSTGASAATRFQAFMARELSIAIHAERGFLESGERMARDLCREIEESPEFIQLGAQAHHHLATILRESGRLKEAEQHSRRAVRLSEDFQFAPFTRAVIRHELGVILWHRGRLDQARKLLVKVLRMQTGFLPPWHPSVLVTRYDLASLHGIEGNLMRALAEFVDIHLTEQDVLRKGHRNTLQTMHQIGQILVELGELDQAEKTLRTVDEEYRTQRLQDRTADVLSTRHEMVHIKAQRGQHSEAHREWEQILKE